MNGFELQSLRNSYLKRLEMREKHAFHNFGKALEEFERESNIFFLKSGFNPDQPRVPAGNSDGGQWTDAGGGSSSGGGGSDGTSPKPSISGPRSSGGHSRRRPINSPDKLPKGMNRRTVPNPGNPTRKPPVNIFVGGLRDSRSGIVRDSNSRNSDVYGENYYAGFDDEDEINDLIKNTPSDRNINLIGHSYGGDTAANIAIQNPGRISKLVTIDPVSRIYTPEMSHVRSSVGSWANINAQPQSRNDSDFIADGGGKWGDDVGISPSRHYNAPTNHDDFDGMMNFRPSNGISARDWLNY
jgi:pimeloyl-ACP methyl ester carboxylesterase